MRRYFCNLKFVVRKVKHAKPESYITPTETSCKNIHQSLLFKNCTILLVEHLSEMFYNIYTQKFIIRKQRRSTAVIEGWAIENRRKQWKQTNKKNVISCLNSSNCLSEKSTGEVLLIIYRTGFAITAVRLFRNFVSKVGWC